MMMMMMMMIIMIITIIKWKKFTGDFLSMRSFIKLNFLCVVGGGREGEGETYVVVSDFDF